MRGQVQDRSALRAGQSGGDIDDAAPQRRSACAGVLVAGEHAGGAQQVVGDRGAQDPGGVGAEASRRQMRQRSVDQVGEHGLDDRVLAVGDVGLVDRQVGVGEERVIPPDREQRIGVASVFDAAHHKPGGDPITAGPESGIGDFGDLGIGDPGAGVGIAHGAGVTHGVQASAGIAAIALSIALLRVIASENCAPCRTHARTTLREPKAESPRTRICPAVRAVRAVRAVPIAWATIRPAPLAEPVLPARSRSPAITGAERGVLIVVPSGDSPLRRTCLPAILVCP